MFAKLLLLMFDGAVAHQVILSTWGGNSGIQHGIRSQPVADNTDAIRLRFHQCLFLNDIRRWLVALTIEMSCNVASRPPRHVLSIARHREEATARDGPESKKGETLFFSLDRPVRSVCVGILERDR